MYSSCLHVALCSFRLSDAHDHRHVMALNGQISCDSVSVEHAANAQRSKERKINIDHCYHELPPMFSFGVASIRSV